MNNRWIMQQKVFLIGEIHLFCIYNFNYPNKKLAIPSKLRNSSAEFPRYSRKTFAEKKTNLAWVLGAEYIRRCDRSVLQMRRDGRKTWDENTEEVNYRDAPAPKTVFAHAKCIIKAATLKIQSLSNKCFDICPNGGMEMWFWKIILYNWLLKSTIKRKEYITGFPLYR